MHKSFPENLIISFYVLIASPIFSQSNQVEQPVKIFEELWNEFNDRYADFELKKVNWKDVYKIYRPKVTAETRNQELFEICCSMLQELNDGHVTLEAIYNDAPLECDPPYTYRLFEEFKDQKSITQFIKVISKELTELGFGKKGETVLPDDTYMEYSVSADLGYLRLDGMMESLKIGLLNRIFNSAFEKFKSKMD